MGLLVVPAFSSIRVEPHRQPATGNPQLATGNRQLTTLLNVMSRVDPPGRRQSALVVDDDPALQGLVHTLLGRDGFAVDCAPNARTAFEYIRRGSYSVILLDLMMPDV